MPGAAVSLKLLANIFSIVNCVTSFAIAEDPQVEEARRRAGAIPIEVQERRLGANRLQMFRIILPGAGQNAYFALELIEDRHRLQFQLTLFVTDEPQPAHQVHLSAEQQQRIIKRFVDQQQEIVEALSEACQLQAAQQKKLQAAAALMARQFIRQLQADFAGTAEQQAERGLDPAAVQASANEAMELGILSPNSLFIKILSTVITAEQQTRWQAHIIASKLDQIDQFASLSLDAQVRELALSFPKPGQTAANFEKLNSEQRRQLVELIQATHQTTWDPLELINSSTRLDLLDKLEKEQLDGFLAPAQVQAVLRQKAIDQRQREFVQRMEAIRIGQVDQIRFLQRPLPIARPK